MYKKKLFKRIVSVMLVISMVIGLMPIQGLFVKEAEAAYKATEDDLFYKCPEYLSNYAYDHYLNLCYDSIEDAMEDVTTVDTVASSFLYSLQNGLTFLINDIGSNFGLTENLTQSSSSAIIRELVVDYANSNVALKSDVDEFHSDLKKVNTVIKWDNMSQVAKYKEELKATNINLSDSQIDEIVDNFSETSEAGQELLGKIGDGLNVASVVLAMIELYAIEQELLNDMYVYYYDIDPDFANEIWQMLDEKASPFTYIYNNYLRDEIISGILSYVTKGSVLGMMKLVGFTLEKTLSFAVPSVSSIVQSSMCLSYMSMCERLISQCETEFKLGTYDSTTRDKFEMAYGMYLSFTKTAMSKVKGCVDMTNGYKKNILDSRAAALTTSITYDTYIESCLAIMQADIDAGLLKISDKVEKKTPDGTVIDDSYDSTESITAKLSVIMNKYPTGSIWTDTFDGAIQCFGFAKLVFYNLYGRTLGTTYYPNARYMYYDTSSAYLVSQVSGSNVTAANIQNVMSSARIGDLIQMYGAGYGQHTMVFLGLTSNGIQVYDCNAHLNGDTRDCVINNWTISYNSLASMYGTGDATSTNGISVYRASNYSEIYGDGTELFYDDSVNFVIQDGVLTKYNGWQSFVEIPEEVTAIGDKAFYGNTSMMNVSIPDGVESIGAQAFYGCTNLRGVTIPDSVETIGSGAFQNCSRMASVILPKEYLVNIAENTFSNCTSLIEVYIPDCVTAVGNGAFANCTSLETVVISDSVVSLGSGYYVTGVFANCKNLKNVTMSMELEWLGEDCFNGCSELEEIFIPKTVTGTGYYADAFANCEKLKTIILEDGMTTIPEKLFTNCKSIESIDIPDTVTIIGANAFGGCTGLKELNIPDSVTLIGDGAFNNCTGLEEVDIPDSVTKLGSGYYVTGVFAGCTKLKKVTMPCDLQWIGEDCFNGCSELEEIFIPKTVTGTGYYANAFANCKKLKTIILEEGMTAIPEKLFTNCTSIEEIIIPDTVKTIGNSSFSGCTGLKELVIPDTVTSIGNNAFSNCSGLEKITLSKGLTKINSSVFSGCTSLKDIDIPNNIKEIAGSAFYGCESLENISLKENLVSIGYSVFEGCESLSKIEIPDTVTALGARAFAECSVLVDVILGEGIRKVESNTFYQCMSLQQIVIPRNVTEIGDSAFVNCTKLTSIAIPDTTVTIADNAFSYPKKMTIHGYEGSYAQEYADNKGITFVMTALDDVSEDDIQIEYDHWDFDRQVTLTTKLITEADDEYKDIEVDEDVEFKAYDITMVDAQGNEVQPYEEVTVKIPCPVEYDGEKCNVYHIDANGKMEDMNAEYVDGYFVIVTDSFSVYLVTESEIDTHEHTYTKTVVKEASCTEEGKVKFVCDICGDSYEEEITKLEHSWETEYTVDKAATYDEVGSKSIHCSVCDTIKEGSKVEIPKLEKAEFTYGDTNDDGRVNVMDAVLMKKHIAGFENLTINLDACDVNVDTRINVMDAVMVLKYIAGFDVVLGE